ncbi:2-isopropylmalate synthase [Moraxella oculi]|uniref:2-isopropylmalate synthase n=1 Tax=Moraxella oculi TaxID=2940516 RepID=A0ABW8U384_9GAMM
MSVSKIIPKNPAFNHNKYRPFDFAPHLPDRTWCDKRIDKAPIWASVDLRDGNQALIDPMTIEQKLKFFKLLVAVGFKQIEIGFPSASQIEFDFTRLLIEGGHVPDDVTIQVLVQSRKHLIERTFESLQGAKKAIIHVYNSTSKVQRDKVYQLDKQGIKSIAVAGATWVKEIAQHYPDTLWIFEYSPESFSQTETDFAIEVCQAVCDVWQPAIGQQVILNLPATVEASTPNLYADQIEYFCRHLPSRQDVIISLHTHNDRGCGVAASELGVMAGADRVEGTLLGNGERTGNMDILTMAMNLYTQGIDPELDLSQMSAIVQVATECTNLPVHPRHAYVGDLVFTAFSGSHQDAIKKSLNHDDQHPKSKIYWEVPYLPIDPADIGRGYQELVRINSQSGKGGVAYVLQQHYGFDLPRWTQIDFAKVVQRQAESLARELKNEELLNMFTQTFLSQEVFKLSDYQINNKGSEVFFDGQVSVLNTVLHINGRGNGALSAFIDGLVTATNKNIHVTNYSEHAINTQMTPSMLQDFGENQTNSTAAAYVQLNVEGEIYSGVGVCNSTLSAMLKSALSALSQAW